MSACEVNIYFKILLVVHNSSELSRWLGIFILLTARLSSLSSTKVAPAECYKEKAFALQISGWYCFMQTFVAQPTLQPEHSAPF